jgi:hypothetical protein
MKRAIILLLFVFVTFLTSSCMVGLRRDDYYRNNPNYQYNDNQGNYHRRGRLFRNRHERNNRNDLKFREGQNTLIIH